jgi:hypothetical protein
MREVAAAQELLRCRCAVDQLWTTRRMALRTGAVGRLVVITQSAEQIAQPCALRMAAPARRCHTRVPVVAQKCLRHRRFCALPPVAIRCVAVRVAAVPLCGLTRAGRRGPTPLFFAVKN